MNETKSVFDTLYAVDVSAKIEKIGKLSYVSWPVAWAEVKKAYPEANYTIYENKDGWIYHTDGRTAWVKTGVTINGIEHIECLPVMNNIHKSIPLDKVDSFAVNTAIQRSLTKACARHGLGLRVYAGEDLLLYKEKDCVDVYEPLPDEVYVELVAAAAENRLTKKGELPRDYFVRKTQASGVILAQFDDDVKFKKSTL